jgi:ribosome assembly protein YihI (activator of Der GTPase)
MRLIYWVEVVDMARGLKKIKSMRQRRGNRTGLKRSGLAVRKNQVSALKKASEPRPPRIGSKKAQAKVKKR